MASQARSLKAIWNRRTWLLVEALVLSAVLLAVYLAHAGRVIMHIDENNWILTSNAWEPFIMGDRSSSIWGDSYWTLTAPPATRYVVGAGRAMGGYGPHELLTPWTFGASAEQNTAAGAMPSEDLLWWSRFPMVVLAVAACLGSFLLMRFLFGSPAAYLGVALLALNPWITATLVRAMAEAPLVCSLLLTVAAATRIAVAANRGSGLRVRLAWLAIAGFGAGLAGSFKLSGLTVLTGVLAVWIGVAALGRPLQPTLERGGTAVLGIALAVTLAGATLVMFNPYLDPDPPARMARLLQFRAEEMRGQLQLNPAWSVKSTGDRLQFIFSYVFEQAVLLRHPAAGVAGLALWLVGLGFIARRVHNGLKQRQLDPAGAALIVALSAAGPMLATPLKWDRYLFLPVWFSALLIALGVTVWVRWLVCAALKRRGWRTGARLDETPGWPQTRPES